MSFLTIVIVIVLVSLSGLFSGLTLGLLSLKPSELKRKMRLGDTDAKRVLSVRQDGNFLLCVLLLGNVAVNTALSIFLGSITSGVLAGLIATALIVVFGEILPQALFSRYALRLGAKTIPLVKLFSFLLFPIAKPLGLGLDKMLGRELPTPYSKKELNYLIEEQVDLDDSDIDQDDLNIVQKSLTFSDRQVRDIMTPRNQAFLLEKDTHLDPHMINLIHKEGFSRIPVYDVKRDKIIGMLFVKDLITIDPEDNMPVNEIMRKKVGYVQDTALLADVLKQFRQTHIHMFIVQDKKKNVVGIVTLEDVLEEIVGEIEDEHDE